MSHLLNEVKSNDFDDDVPDNDTCEILPENTQEKSSLSFKIIVIGNSGVGKTCLSLRALKGSFSSDSIPTIGFEFLNLMVKLREKVISLQIWDTCGQEAYQSVVSKFYKRAAMAILVYSIDDRNSFENLDTWLKELRDNASPEVKVALVGNKIDLGSQRVVSKEEALQYKQSRNIDLIFESSAKHGDNSKDIFTESAKMLYKDYVEIYSSSNFMNEKELEKTGHEKISHPYGSNLRLPGKNSLMLEKDLDNPGGSCTHC